MKKSPLRKPQALRNTPLNEAIKALVSGKLSKADGIVLQRAKKIRQRKHAGGNNSRPRTLSRTMISKSQVANLRKEIVAIRRRAKTLPTREAEVLNRAANDLELGLSTGRTSRRQKHND